MHKAVLQAPASFEDFPLEAGELRAHQKTGVYPVCIDELAHELRQPLSVIESLAYYLEITASDERSCHQFQQIRLMVDQASRILDRAVA